MLALMLAFALDPSVPRISTLCHSLLAKNSGLTRPGTRGAAKGDAPDGQDWRVLLPKFRISLAETCRAGTRDRWRPGSRERAATPACLRAISPLRSYVSSLMYKFRVLPLRAEGVILDGGRRPIARPFPEKSGPFAGRATDRASRVQSRSNRVSGDAVSTVGCRPDRRLPPASPRRNGGGGMPGEVVI